MTTISIQCVHCHKRYNAPAAMAGKKVKCKHCGKVFAIPADAASPNEGEVGLSAMGVDAAAESRAPAPAASRSGSRVGGKLGHASAGYASKMARPESVAEIDLANENRGFHLRPSVPHDIPGAAVVEQFAPPLMAVIGLGWLGWTAFQSADGTGVGWAGGVRALAYLALSLGLAFPSGYWAVKHAARKHRFMLPPSPGLRALASFCLPFALAFVLWLAGESVGMLAMGAVLGLVVALGAVWFLFRLQPQETPTTLGSVAGAFVGSVVIAYFVLFGIHTVFATALAKSGTNQFAKSPIGPFAWDLPKADGGGNKAKARTVVSTSPSPSPTRTVVNMGAATTQSVATGSDAAPGTQSTVPPNQIAAAIPNGTGGTPESKPDTTKGTTPENPSAETSPPSATTKPQPDKTAATAPVEPAVVASPIVAKVTPLDDVPKGFNQFFASPTSAANVFGVMKKGAAEETVTLFSGNPPKKTAAQPEPFPIEAKVTQNYCVTNGGETMARLTTFPKVAVQLVSTATGQETKTIPLDETLGTPHVLGFGVNDAVVVLWTNGSRKGVEVLNSKTGKRVTVFNLRDPFEQTASNPIISPDGRQLAVATVVDNKGAIDLYDLGPGLPARTPRSLMVQLAQWDTPLGMCYSADGKFVSAYFEVLGNGVLFHFQTGIAKEPVAMHVFRGSRALSPNAAAAAANAEAAAQAGVPARRNAAGGAAGAFTGKALEFVSPNEWLVFGRHVIDVESGRPVGELGVANPKAQRVLDKETVLIQTADAAGNAELLQVKLNAEQIATKRGELRGGAKTGLNK